MTVESNISTFQKVKHWLEGFAHKPYSTCALFIISFLESSLVPIPPDALLVPLCLARPKRSLYYAFMVAFGSTVGAMLGYFIGLTLFDAVGAQVLHLFDWQAMFETVLNKYREHAVSALLFAGFLPIPFQVFTLAAGWNETVPLATFIVATLGGRLVRFFLVGGMLFALGERAKTLLEQYFVKIVLAVGTLLILWIIASKFLIRP